VYYGGKKERQSRSRFMKPLEWLKAFYDTFGTPYPRISLIAVMGLGAIFCGAVWLFAAKQVAKDHQATSATPSVSGPATTSGNNSPANTGPGNTITYDQSSHPVPKPKKE
jgi:hypothetical protein